MFNNQISFLFWLGVLRGEVGTKTALKTYTRSHGVAMAVVGRQTETPVALKLASRHVLSHHPNQPGSVPHNTTPHKLEGSTVWLYLVHPPPAGALIKLRGSTAAARCDCGFLLLFSLVTGWLVPDWDHASVESEIIVDAVAAAAVAATIKLR